jgi:RIO kinase 1
MPDEYIFATTKQEKQKTRRKIFKDVFDDRTEKNLQAIERRGNLDYVIGPISNGKEANLFIGKKGKTFVCVKIYRIETTNFHNRRDYIDDDELNKIANNPIKRIYAWCEREYFNLKFSAEHKVLVPKSIDQQNNVLVMQLIGSNGKPHPTLKYDETVKKNIKEIYKQYVENMYKLIYKAKMVHADLSEYNLIFFKDKLWFIDMGQSVSTKYPKAKTFLERDLKTIIKFFNNNGLKVTLEELKEDIKKGKI